MRAQDVTVVVPTRNEAANIARFLGAVPQALPVLLVDASTDGTAAIARRLRPRNLRVVLDDGNVATARQRGAELAQSEWLLYSDADVELAPDYLVRLERMAPPDTHGAVVGAKLSRDRHAAYYRAFSSWLGLLCRLGLPAASGSNLLVRRSALVEAGGFDTDLPCNEDSELVLRLRRAGFAVSYSPELRVYEFDHRRLDGGVLRKTLHSLVRGALLDGGLLGPAHRRDDWGYWAARGGQRPPPARSGPVDR